jgi:hypothetical protein
MEFLAKKRSNACSSFVIYRLGFEIGKIDWTSMVSFLGLEFIRFRNIHSWIGGFLFALARSLFSIQESTERQGSSVCFISAAVLRCSCAPQLFAFLAQAKSKERRITSASASRLGFRSDEAFHRHFLLERQSVS